MKSLGKEAATITAIVLVIAVAGAVALRFSSDPAEPGGQNVREAKLAIAALLKDPESVRWGDIVQRGKYFCGALSAKNSFGGYTGMSRFVYDGDLLDVDGPEGTFEARWFAEKWQKGCE